MVTKKSFNANGNKTINARRSKYYGQDNDMK